jgi:hypothetical protein
MKATELFKDEVDWASENAEELSELNAEFHKEGIEILDKLADALRLLEVQDVDLSEEVVDVMESGEVMIWAPDKVDRIEDRLLQNEPDYSVRLALIDTTKPSAALAIAQAMLLDADIIVAGPYKVGSTGDVADHLMQAAQAGHSVIALGEP